MRRARSVWADARGGAVAGALLAAGALCCAGQKGPESAANAADKVAPKDTEIRHEDCEIDDDDAVSEDVNGDGRPDRTTVASGGKPICRALDFNFDGSIDDWVYLDEAGNVRRRESDFDRDGRVDEVALFSAGQLLEKRRATTLGGKWDTWHYYQQGKLARTERDSNGDTYVDQWWEYPDARGSDCPLIHSDVDGDGRPDPGATVDVCSDRYAAAAFQSEEENDDQAGPGIGALPTEVDSSAQPDPESDSEEEGDDEGDADVEESGEEP